MVSASLLRLMEGRKLLPDFLAVQGVGMAAVTSLAAHRRRQAGARVEAEATELNRPCRGLEDFRNVAAAISKAMR
jgi:hypothetical protein